MTAYRDRLDAGYYKPKKDTADKPKRGYSTKHQKVREQVLQPIPDEADDQA